MSWTHGEARQWVVSGTKLLDVAIASLNENSLDQASALPSWTRKHLIAHINGNARALSNLVHWAATGIPTPMYSSPEQRNADIEAGAKLPLRDLLIEFGRTATDLSKVMDQLTPKQWDAPVVTAQGRTVPASTVPWLRAREVMVHAIDLATGLTFADLPDSFLFALGEDIGAKRSAAGDGPSLHILIDDTDTQFEVAGHGSPTTVTGPLASVTAYLAGRPAPVPARGTDGPAPRLPPWL